MKKLTLLLFLIFATANMQFAIAQDTDGDGMPDVVLNFNI